MRPTDGVMVSALPDDWRDGSFVGRVQTDAGPSPILLVRGRTYDMAAVTPTVAALTMT